jgi:hypothetical protein
MRLSSFLQNAKGPLQLERASGEIFFENGLARRQLRSC